jgi:hypothetical protein
MLRCERLARQWHARGQGFKSPQLHQAQRIGRTPAQGRLSADCQQITPCGRNNALSAARFRRLQLQGGGTGNFAGDTVAEVADQARHGVGRVCDSDSLGMGFLAHTVLSLDDEPSPNLKIQ